MKKYIVLFIFSFCLSSLYGQGGDEPTAPTKPLPVPPTEPQKPTKPLPVPPKSSTWQSATPDPNLKNWQRTKTTSRMQEKEILEWLNGTPWKKADGSYDIDYRRSLGMEGVYKVPGCSNWSASAMTLVATMDEVLIRDIDLKNMDGYWSQWRSVYGLNDASIFPVYRLHTDEITVAQMDSPLIFMSLLKKGPIMIAVPGTEYTWVITGISHNPNNQETIVKYYDPRLVDKENRIDYFITPLNEFIIKMKLFSENIPLLTRARLVE